MLMKAFKTSRRVDAFQTNKTEISHSVDFSHWLGFAASFSVYETSIVMLFNLRILIAHVHSSMHRKVDEVEQLDAFALNHDSFHGLQALSKIL